MKLFRKIRENLLSNNKFTKYLLYAIGEIFLVVVGILIALYLNNLNSQDKQQKELIEAITGISKELNQEIIIMRKDMSDCQSKAEYLNAILDGSYSELNLNLFMRVLTTNSIPRDLGANYFAALSAGKLEGLPNSIADKLISYYHISLKISKNKFLFHQNLVSNTIEDYVMRNYKLGYNKEMNLERTIEIIKSEELITFINYQARIFTNNRAELESNINEADELKYILDRYIE